MEQDQQQENPESNPYNTQSPVPSKLSPSLIIIIGIVLLTVLGAGGYYLWMPSLTKNMQSNSTVSSPSPEITPFDVQSFISYTIPSGWTQDVMQLKNHPGLPTLPEISPQFARQLFSPFNPPNGKLPDAGIDIIRLDSQGQKPHSIQQLIETINHNKLRYLTTPNYMQTTIDGNPALHFKYTFENHYFILQGDSLQYTWHISMTLMSSVSAQPKERLQYETQFDQFIHSIHFK